MSFIDTDYIRPFGSIFLAPKVSQNWFGYGSKEELELFDQVTKTASFGQTSYSRGIDPTTGWQLPDCIWSPERYVSLFGVTDNLDTRLSEWGTCPYYQNTVNANAWQEERTVYPPLRYRLVQTDSTAGKYFSRRSTFQHGLNSSFAIHIDVPNPPSDTDLSLGQPFAAVAWGNWRWAIFFIPDGSPILAEWRKTAWFPVLQLKPLPRTPKAELTGEDVVLVERTRRAIIINGYYEIDFPWSDTDAEDFAAMRLEEKGAKGEYARGRGGEDCYYREDEPYWNAGPFDFFGFGLAASLGISTVSYPTLGSYYSPKPPIPQPRGSFFGTDVPIFYPDWEANGGVVSVTNLNGPSDSFFQFRVDMAPARQVLGSKVWQKTPSLHGMGVFYPALPITGFATFGDGGQTLEGRIEACSVDKPEKLDDRSFEAELLFPDGFRLLTGDWRETPAKVFLGRDGGPLGSSATTVFSGYITKMHARREHVNMVRASMTLSPAALRPKRMRFGHSTMPRGGLTLNQALDVWLLGRGMPLSQRFWDPLGNLVTLYKGFPENPPFWPDPEGDSWEWHQRLCEVFGLELSEDDDGNFWTTPIEGYQITPVYWHASVPVTPETVPQNLEGEGDTLETYTRVFVYAKTHRGEEIARWVINWDAEQNPTYPGFRPWKEEHKTRLDFGPVDPGFVTLAAISKAQELLIPKVYGNWEGEFNPYLGRKMLVTIYGDGMELQGIHKIRALKHTVPAGPDFNARTILRTERRLA